MGKTVAQLPAAYFIVWDHERCTTHTALDLRLQRPPRRPLRRVPGRALPCGARRARRRVFHAGRLERRAPGALVVLSQLEVVALAVHSNSDVTRTRSRATPAAPNYRGPA